MNNVKILKITYDKNLNDLKHFFENVCGSSSDSFTYFKKRGYDFIKNHLVTNMLYVDDMPAAYSHLDKDENDTWFGICVGEQFKGKRLGEKLMVQTLNDASEKNIKTVLLSVYKDNTGAINLYKKLGFYTYKENDISFFMKKEI